MKCANCNEELDQEMDIEYSQELTLYFCSPKCATHYYFEEMRSIPVLPKEMTVEELKERGIKVVEGKLYEQ